MQRANAVQMRKALMAVEVLKKAGILFVPVPIIDEEDFKLAIAEVDKRFEMMIAEAEKEEGEK